MGPLSLKSCKKYFKKALKSEQRLCPPEYSYGTTVIERKCEKVSW